jgi:hypothetical protein
VGAGGPHDWITVADNPDGVAVYNGVALVRPGGRHGYAAPRTVPMLAVLPARADSSSGGQCWADATRWGPLGGQLVHTSYSRLAMFYILTQDVKPHPNGFAVRMPLEFHSGLMRARTNPVDGQVYVLGHKGWDTHARYDGCLCRIRHVQEPTRLIVAARATARGLRLTFGCDLDAASIVKKNFEVVREENQGTTPVDWGAVRALDKRTIEIELPEIDQETVARRTHADKKTGKPTIDILAPLRVTARIKAADGTPIEQELFATINSLP